MFIITDLMTLKSMSLNAMSAACFLQCHWENPVANEQILATVDCPFEIEASLIWLRIDMITSNGNFFLKLASEIRGNTAWEKWNDDA